MSDIFFKPWIGELYGDKGIFGKKILALGLSHYCRHCKHDCEFNNEFYCTNITNRVITDYLKDEKAEYNSTFKNFEKAISPNNSKYSTKEIWNSIAFYNYVQRAVPYQGADPTAEQWKVSEEPFFEVITELKPELIIAWGTSLLYNCMPPENWRKGEPIEIEGKKIKYGFYKTYDDAECDIVFIYHPSCYIGKSKFIPQYWHKVIEHFL